MRYKFKSSILTQSYKKYGPKVSFHLIDMATQGNQTINCNHIDPFDRHSLENDVHDGYRLSNVCQKNRDQSDTTKKESYDKLED